MELKQLEYFTIVCKKGSFSQAAECLYTLQPNVSEIISSLEKELGQKLVERSSRGLRITPFGETVRDYAKLIPKHTSLINSMATHHSGKKFTLATYPSNMITSFLVDFYQYWGNEYVVEHQEGSVEEISNWVARGQSELGVVYIANVFIKWAWYARMIRTGVMQYRDRNFVQFSRCVGMPERFILFRHLLPSITSDLVVLASLDVGWAIINISTLSFLGLGVQAPTPEWGAVLNEAKNVMTSNPVQMIAPGIAIVVLVCVFNLMGDALRDVLDPKEALK
ncbi:MAG: ABC transporter permease subunit [Lachnospiraceae bacterium]|nr:ABC transporter permease subunit [Lachnospiraceae bacterium]